MMTMMMTMTDDDDDDDDESWSLTFLNEVSVGHLLKCQHSQGSV